MFNGAVTLLGCNLSFGINAAANMAAPLLLNLPPNGGGQFAIRWLNRFMGPNQNLLNFVLDSVKVDFCQAPNSANYVTLGQDKDKSSLTPNAFFFKYRDL